jgi:hypothetical protein
MRSFRNSGAVAILLIAWAGTACRSGSSAAPSPPAAPTPTPPASAEPDPNPLSDGIRKNFATKYSCPEARVVVKERSDLDPFKTLSQGEDFSLGNAPDEVRADPGRYAKWKADREQFVAREKQQYTQNTMFEVSGCNHTEILGCHPTRDAARPWILHTTIPECISPPAAHK